MFLLTSSSGVVHENSIANTFGSRLSEKRDCTRWRHLLDSLESLVFWAFQLRPMQNKRPTPNQLQPTTNNQTWNCTPPLARVCWPGGWGYAPSVVLLEFQCVHLGWAKHHLLSLLRGNIGNPVPRKDPARFSRGLIGHAGPWDSATSGFVIDGVRLLQFCKASLTST